MRAGQRCRVTRPLCSYAAAPVESAQAVVVQLSASRGVEVVRRLVGGEELGDAVGGGGEGVLAARRSPALEGLGGGGRERRGPLEVPCLPPRVRLTEEAVAGSYCVDDIFRQLLVARGDVPQGGEQ